MDPQTDTTAPHTIRVEVEGGDAACAAPDGVRFERLPTHPAALRRLTGYRAIEAAERWAGITLANYNTPEDDAEDDISVERARELAAADPGLVYAVADLLFAESELETWAVCGPLRVLITTDIGGLPIGYRTGAIGGVGRNAGEFMFTDGETWHDRTGSLFGRPGPAVAHGWPNDDAAREEAWQHALARRTLPGDGVPLGCEVIAPATLGANLDELAGRVADALAARLAEMLEEAG